MWSVNSTHCYQLRITHACIILQATMLAYRFLMALSGSCVASVVGECLGSNVCERWNEEDSEWACETRLENGWTRNGTGGRGEVKIKKRKAREREKRADTKSSVIPDIPQRTSSHRLHASVEHGQENPSHVWVCVWRLQEQLQLKTILCSVVTIMLHLMQITWLSTVQWQAKLVHNNYLHDDVLS